MTNAWQKLFDALKEIVSSTEQADKEREDTLAAVKNISDIIAETAEGQTGSECCCKTAGECRYHESDGSVTG